MRPRRMQNAHLFHRDGVGHMSRYVGLASCSAVKAPPELCCVAVYGHR